MNKEMSGYARSGKARKNKTLLTAILTLSLFAIAPLVSYAEDSAPAQPAIPELPAQAPSPVNCFDYYKFQSVQVSLGTDKDVYLPGETVSLKGELINQNDYPVVDGNVFARISEKNPQYQSQGQFSIDEKILDTDVNLDSKERKKVSYQWTVPESIKKGDYRVDFFFSVGKKFNLGGLPFTNEIIVGFADFQINSPSTSTIIFDKSKTTVDGKKYNHIGNWPSITANNRVEIIQPIKNTFNQAKNVEVQYDLYFWDSLNEKDKLSTETKEITVPANGSADLKYAIAQMKDSVYMLKITATSGDYKSIVNIRLTSDQQHARLNYPAITKFPLSKDDNFTLFSCFHNTSWSDTSGSVQLSLYDKRGKLVDQMEYQGAISGAMMADKKDITANKDYDYLRLEAKVLDKDGKTIDEYSTVYDCAKINSESCRKALLAAPSITEQVATASKTPAIIVLIVILVILILTFISVIVKRKKAPMAVIIFFCAIISMAVFSGGKAEAKYEQSASENISKGKTVGFIDSYFVSILHKAEMTQGDLVVNINDPLKFSYNPELAFNAVGGLWDSPYGFWVKKWPDFDETKKNLESKMEKQEDIESFLLFKSAWGPIEETQWWSYTTFFAINPAVIIISSNPDIIACNGMDCAAKSVGKTTLTAQIDSTQIQPVIFYRMPELIGIISPGVWARLLLSTVGSIPQSFSWDVEVKGPATCIGTAPAYAGICPLDDRDLIIDTMISLVSSCTPETKCEYTCNPGYIFSEGLCKTPQAPPPPPVVILPSGTTGEAVSGKTYCQLPTDRTQLCSSGTATGIKLKTTNGITEWIWSCVGSDNVDIPGSAVKDCSWTEVNP